MFLEKYVPWSFCDCKKDEFSVLAHGDILVAAYAAKFHMLSHYATQMLTSKEERIMLYIKGMIYDLQVLCLYMTSAGKGFNKVSNYVKKLEGVTEVNQAKILADKSWNVRNFNWYYSKVHDYQTYSAHHIQLILLASVKILAKGSS